MVPHVKNLREFTKPKLILVEGPDDVSFFIKLIDHLEIKNFYVYAVDSVTKFNSFLEKDIVNIRGFNRLTHLAIIRDKDSGTIEDACSSITNILSIKTKIERPASKHGLWSDGSPKTGIFIMPGKLDGTMLEDLCLSTVNNKPEMKCVNEFANCIETTVGKTKNMAKTKTIAFLAAQEEPVSTINLGSLKKYWNLDAPELNELKQFLSELK